MTREETLKAAKEGGPKNHYVISLGPIIAHGSRVQSRHPRLGKLKSHWRLLRSRYGMLFLQASVFLATRLSASVRDHFVCSTGFSTQFLIPKTPRGATVEAIS